MQRPAPRPRGSVGQELAGRKRLAEKQREPSPAKASQGSEEQDARPEQQVAGKRYRGGKQRSQGSEMQ